MELFLLAACLSHEVQMSGSSALKLCQRAALPKGMSLLIKCVLWGGGVDTPYHLCPAGGQPGPGTLNLPGEELQSQQVGLDEKRKTCPLGTLSECSFWVKWG